MLSSGVEHTCARLPGRGAPGLGPSLGRLVVVRQRSTVAPSGASRRVFSLVRRDFHSRRPVSELAGSELDINAGLAKASPPRRRGGLGAVQDLVALQLIEARYPLVKKGSSRVT